MPTFSCRSRRAWADFAMGKQKTASKIVDKAMKACRRRRCGAGGGV